MKHNILVALVMVAIGFIFVDIYTDFVGGFIVDIPAIVGVAAPIVLLTAVIIWQIKNKS